MGADGDGLPPRQRIILNPGAGSAEGMADLEQRLAAMPGTDLVRTESSGDATRAAREACAAGIARIVAAGGDGTLHEVVQGVAPDFNRVQLGLLPLGTGNDFARSVGIPSALEPALAILDRGRERAVDVFRVEVEGGGDRFLLNASSAGFSAIVSEHADAQKEGWGALAYSVGAMKALPDLRVYRLRFQVDDGPEEEVAAWAFVLANGGTIAGGIPVVPAARLDDGRADLLVVPEMPMTALAVVLARILLGKHTGDPSLLFRSGRRFRMDSEPSMPLNTDGELAGETPVSYAIHTRQLRLLAPSEKG